LIPLLRTIEKTVPNPKTIMHLSMSSPRGAGVRHKVGILTFPKKKIIKIPSPAKKIMVKNNGQKYGLLFCPL